MAAKNRKCRWVWNTLWFIAGGTLVFLAINHSIFDPIKQPLKDLLNSNFSTAFFGAAGGALTIFILDWANKRRLILADINASIGVLTNLSNTLLNIKKQHALPILQSFQSNVAQYNTYRTVITYSGSKESPGVLNVPMYLKRFHCPQLHFDLPMDRIFTLTDKLPGIVPRITQVKQSIGEVENIIDVWNELVAEMKNVPGDDKVAVYFGLPDSQGATDTYFPDTVQNVSLVVDDALFFIDKAIRSLTKMGKITLPFWLKKKIAKSEIMEEEYKKLMPSPDYKKGWDDE